jgi:hypothetical protein
MTEIDYADQDAKKLKELADKYDELVRSTNGKSKAELANDRDQRLDVLRNYESLRPWYIRWHDLWIEGTKRELAHIDRLLEGSPQ